MFALLALLARSDRWRPGCSRSVPRPRSARAAPTSRYIACPRWQAARRLVRRRSGRGRCRGSRPPTVRSSSHVPGPRLWFQRWWTRSAERPQRPCPTDQRAPGRRTADSVAARVSQSAASVEEFEPRHARGVIHPVSVRDDSGQLDHANPPASVASFVAHHTPARAPGRSRGWPWEISSTIDWTREPAKLLTALSGCQRLSVGRYNSGRSPSARTATFSGRSSAASGSAAITRSAYRSRRPRPCPCAPLSVPRTAPEPGVYGHIADGGGRDAALTDICAGQGWVTRAGG